MSTWQCPDCGSIGTPYVAEIAALRARVANLEGALNAAIARGAALEHENAALRWRVSELEAEADGQEGA